MPGRGRARLLHPSILDGHLRACGRSTGRVMVAVDWDQLFVLLDGVLMAVETQVRGRMSVGVAVTACNVRGPMRWS